jgi:putative colanic acid biosynthesis acetyltransferase WcaF
MIRIDLKYSNYKNKLSLKNKIGRAIWNITFFLLVRPLPSKGFNSWYIFILRLFGAKIGKNCTVKNTVIIWAPWNLKMENNTLIDSHCYCYNPGLVHLKAESIISFNVSLITATHNIYSYRHELIIKPITIEQFVWIASEAFIGPGVTIGEGAVVAARAVVVKNVEPWTIVGGNPSKFIKKRVIEA